MFQWQRRCPGAELSPDLLARLDRAAVSGGGPRDLEERCNLRRATAVGCSRKHRCLPAAGDQAGDWLYIRALTLED